MAKQDPVEGLRRFADRLKRQPIKDGRTTRKEYMARVNSNISSGDFGWGFDPGQSWLVRQWQALSILELSHTGNDLTKYRHPGPAYWVDDSTAIVTVESLDGGVYLVWRQDADYVCRSLSDSEVDAFRRWSLQILYSKFGFSSRRRPPARSTRGKKRKPR